ncbi:hypothetical protein [Paenibacillus tepidiphilus]|nr:hypothetical protein [Paenibacillus tepidiphilus]
METKPLRLRTSEQAERLAAHKVGDDPTGLEGVLQSRKNYLNL